jgi:hypothetical protein
MLNLHAAAYLDPDADGATHITPIRFTQSAQEE